MDGPKIVEYGLKGIVLVLDVGFFFCLVLFQIAAWSEFFRNRRLKREAGIEDEKSATFLFFLMSIVSGLVSIVLSGLVLMKWWT